MVLIFEVELLRNCLGNSLTLLQKGLAPSQC